jgi:glyoxylase-like metal-dependent hydrolase (beta-lactamase superfamily II)
MEGTKIAYPFIAFEDRLEVDLGGQKVELIYVAPSHSSGSILVYLPVEKVLFAGDVLFTGFHPFMGDGDIDGWVRTLDYIESLDVEKIVPGHGPVSGKKDVADMRSYLLAFDKKARELAAGSEDIEYIVEEIKKSLPERTMGEGLIRANIQMKYLRGKTQGEGQ